MKKIVEKWYLPTTQGKINKNFQNDLISDQNIDGIILGFKQCCTI